MKISLHLYAGPESSITRSFDVDEEIDAIQLCEVLRAKALMIWEDNYQGPHIKSGTLEPRTYHVVSHNNVITLRILKTISMISKL